MIKSMKQKSLQTKIPKNLFTKYAGKRVVLINGKVVAVADDAFVAYQEAKEKYPPEKLTIFHVPRKEDKYLLV